eukprot:5404005-Lingulodinium_polyedra.AAC.1
MPPTPRGIVRFQFALVLSVTCFFLPTTRRMCSGDQLGWVWGSGFAKQRPTVEPPLNKGRAWPRSTLLAGGV